MKHLGEERSAPLPLDAGGDGGEGCWAVCRDTEDVKGFDVESFILSSAPRQQNLFSSS